MLLWHASKPLFLSYVFETCDPSDWAGHELNKALIESSEHSVADT